MPLTLADIATGSTGLNAPEAAALAVAAVEAAAGNALPPGDRIVLDDAGRVALTGSLEPASERDRVRQLGALLEVLLRLDDRPGGMSPNVPGAQLVLVERAAGTIDLPPPSLNAFTDALRRLASSDPAALPRLSRRHAIDSADPVPHVPSRAGRRVPIGATIAAAAVIAALAAAWSLSSPSVRVEVEESSVPVVHERAAPDLSVSRGAAPAPDPEPERVDRPVAAATPLLSAGAVGNHVFSPSFGRNGRDLLFHSGRERGILMRASLDGRGRAAITTVLQDGAANYHATLSADGRWLAFDSDRDGVRGVYVAPSDFSDSLQARRISGAGYASMPRWAPGGRRLAFVRAERSRPRVWNVWVADLDAGTLARVSHHRVGQAWAPSWFRGGDRLAYSVEDVLVIADLRRGTSRVVRSPRPGHLVRTPAVSPDGRRVVFQVHRDGAWLLDVATGRVRRVLDDRTAEEFAWSPDSRRVIYHARRDGAWSLWQLDLPPGA
jgi:hypothetical protein